jgi:hypothetical protein
MVERVAAETLQVPEYKPRQGLAMFKSFLQEEPPLYRV